MKLKNNFHRNTIFFLALKPSILKQQKGYPHMANCSGKFDYYNNICLLKVQLYCTIKYIDIVIKIFHSIIIIIYINSYFSQICHYFLKVCYDSISDIFTM